MAKYLKIHIPTARAALFHASRKQTAALFMACLDYAEKRTQPKEIPGDAINKWLLSVFPHFKEDIDGGGKFEN